ncbi:MAG: polysaccharide biosynthesis/export family protein [Verrucomicrobia bacterium]|nr:polysaccharide biosynthesis/export family protein [Verrucomicrobiota bacterium]
MDSRRASRLQRWLLPLFLAAWTGCSHQDLRPPVVGNPFGGRTGREGKTGVEAEEREALFAKVASEVARQQMSDPGDYVVGPGDEIQVSIFALEAPDSTTPVKRTITREGTINLPWVGNIGTESCTVRELERRITEAYAGRFIKNPQISVEVAQFKSRAVVITGAVRNPGVYAMTDNRSTLIEMLSKAGGLLPEASDDVLIVRAPTDETGSPTNGVKRPAKGKKKPAAEVPLTLTISLQTLLNQGDLRENISILPGDVLTVRAEKAGYFYVLGYVSRPGVYTLRSGQQMDPMRAVAMAGGLTATARAENSYQVRTTETGQKVLPVNLVKMTHSRSEPLQLEAGDTLVVGSSFFSRMMEIIRPSVGMGMSYSPLP